MKNEARNKQSIEHMVWFIPILHLEVFHASAWVAEQSKLRPRTEKQSAAPKARISSGFVTPDRIESGRSEGPRTVRIETPRQGKGFPGGEANPRQAGSSRIATPVAQGPSRDHRQ